MRSLAASLAVAALLAAAAVQAESAAARGERQLARMLEGRTAGEPVDCFNWTNAVRPIVIERVAVVYDAGRVIYVARPSNPRLLDPRDTIMVDMHGSHLCASDRFYVVARENNLRVGMADIVSFVPYTRDR